MPEWGNMASDFGLWMNQYGLAAVFLVMLVKQIGFPMPLPGDVIMLAVAAWAATGRLVAWEAFAVILIAIVLGSSFQYLLARRFGEGFLHRFGRRLGVTPEQLDETKKTILRGGARAVAISLLLPGVRVATVPAAGLAAMPYIPFLAGLIVGRGVFLVIHFTVGYLGFPFLSFLVGPESLPVLVVLGVVTTLGFLGWFIWSRRRSAVVEGQGGLSHRQGLVDWSDGACPGCVAASAAHRWSSSRQALRLESMSVPREGEGWSAQRK
jgi:membrane protein DedA with SNARE-associated domain